MYLIRNKVGNVFSGTSKEPQVVSEEDLPATLKMLLTNNPHATYEVFQYANTYTAKVEVLRG